MRSYCIVESMGMGGLPGMPMHAMGGIDPFTAMGGSQISKITELDEEGLESPVKSTLGNKENASKLVIEEKVMKLESNVDKENKQVESEGESKDKVEKTGKIEKAEKVEESPKVSNKKGDSTKLQEKEYNEENKDNDENVLKNSANKAIEENNKDEEDKNKEVKEVNENDEYKEDFIN